MHPQFSKRCGCGAILALKEDCPNCAAMRRAAVLAKRGDFAQHVEVAPCASAPFVGFVPLAIGAHSVADLRTELCMEAVLQKLVIASDEPVVLHNLIIGCKRYNLSTYMHNSGDGMPVPAPYAVLDLPDTPTSAPGLRVVLTLGAVRKTTVHAALVVALPD